MSDSRRIPTPLIYRWRRFCYRYVPIAVFSVCFFATVWMWGRQAQMGNGLGAIRASSVPVYSAAAGTIVAPGDRYWNQYDPIEKGEIVCRLDDQAIAAQLAVLDKQRSQLEAEITAKQAEMRLGVVEYTSEEDQEARRNELALQQLRLTQGQLKQAALESRVEIDRLETELQYLENLYSETGGIPEAEVQQARIAKRQVETRVAELNAQLEEAQSQLEQNNEYAAILKRRRGSYENALSQSLASIVQPLEKAIDVIDAQMNEIELQLNNLVVRAPVSGIITDVLVLPGHAVQPGMPVVTIASTDDSHIVSYVRQDQRVAPEIGMKVRVRNRHSSDRPLEAMITHVGPQVVSVPPEQLRDPATPEWGLPVWIQRPAELQAKPGQQIDIIFPTTRNGTATQTPPASTSDI